MIRAITTDDSAAVSALAVAAGLFPADKIAFLDKMMADYFGGNKDDGHVCIIDVVRAVQGLAHKPDWRRSAKYACDRIQHVKRYVTTCSPVTSAGR